MLPRTFTFACAIVLAFACPALSCNRCGLKHCAFKQAAVVQPVIYPQVSYFVGQPIRVEAIVQKALREDPQWEQFQQFKQWQALRHAEPPAPALVSSLIATKCGSCHSGAKPAKGLVLDGETAVTCEQKVDAMKAVRDGVMPPPSKAAALSPEEKGDVLSELLDLPTIGGDP